MVTTISRDPDPPASNFQTAPISAPPAGQQLVSTLMWNKLLDIIEGISTDKLVLAVLVTSTDGKLLIMRAGALTYDVLLATDIPTLTRSKISDFLPITKGDVEDTGTWAVAEIPNLDTGKITTGQFVMARLASGVPDGTKFIRDDGVLALPAGGSGTDEVLLVPTVNKTIPDNSSLIVGDYYTLGSGISLTIGSNSNLTVV